MAGLGGVRTNPDGSLTVVRDDGTPMPRGKRFGYEQAAARPPRTVGVTSLVAYAEDRQKWQRQPGESSKAYAAFTLYRDLGPFERSIRETARRLVKGATQCSRWNQLWRWEERAGAWDDEQRRVQDEARLGSQREAVKLHERASRALLGQAARVIDTQQKAAQVDPRALQQVSIAMDKAIHHHRLALGLPTDLTRQEHVLKEQLRQMLAVYDGVKAVIEEQLCPDCRQRVGAELRRLGEKQRDLRARQD